MFKSFLEYSKYILETVSFDTDLFIKEYRKAVSLLKGEEVDQLNSWLSSKGLSLQPIRIS